MPNYAVTYTYVDQPDALDAHRPRHREYLGSLADQGVVKGSGPYTDGAPGAVLIFAADSAEQVANLLDDDPFQIEGLIAERSIRGWNIVLGPWAELA